MLVHRSGLRAAFRALHRHYAYSVLVVATLAVAVGILAATFATVDAMINPSVGARHPEQLYTLQYAGDTRERLRPEEVPRALASQHATYKAFTGYQLLGFGMSVSRGASSRNTDPRLVRPHFFTVLGINPLEGQVAHPRPECEPLALS